MTKKYIRPYDDKTEIHDIGDCDMDIMQPLLAMGLWVYAKDDEIKEGVNAARIYSSGESNTGS